MATHDEMSAMFSRLAVTDDGANAMHTPIKYQGVFHSLDAVMAPLKSDQYAGLPEVIELLHAFKNSLNYVAENQDNTKKNLFIVLEGLDGSGKTTITKRLATALRGTKMITPPASISHLRSKFDEHEPNLRRAYYSLGNYIAANEARFARFKEPVIMDRFWNSTAAYAIANEIKQGKPLPPHDSPLYEWPSDLLQPDYIIYLSVSESVRLQRLAKRQACTEEENELKTNKVFRENLGEIYKRMKPRLHFVNCNISPKKVIDIIKAEVIKK